jgi:hypothetical protein
LRKYSYIFEHITGRLAVEERGKEKLQKREGWVREKEKDDD